MLSMRWKQDSDPQQAQQLLNLRSMPVCTAFTSRFPTLHGDLAKQARGPDMASQNLKPAYSHLALDAHRCRLDLAVLEKLCARAHCRQRLFLSGLCLRQNDTGLG